LGALWHNKEFIKTASTVNFLFLKSSPTPRSAPSKRHWAASQ
jgi:hypothetical protein